MLVESIAFIAALFVIAAVILGGLVLVCWHTHSQDTGKPHKKPLLSNWKIRLLWLGAWPRAECGPLPQTSN
jgi:hypothetical protein